MGRIVATYRYTDAEGNLLFEKLRYDPKDFRIRRPDSNGGWIWNLGEVERVPYNLSNLTASPVALITEGEKDADTLNALSLTLFGGGTASTCNFDGAGEGKWLDSYNAYFIGKHCLIFVDNDESGELLAQEIAASVFPFAASVRIIRFTELDDHGDVSDYVEIFGKPALLEKIADAEVYTPTAELLRLCRALIHRYLILSDEQSTIIAAWILLTWAVDAFDVVPYLHITAPEKRCGKSKLLELLSAVVKDAWMTSRATPAVLYRKLDAKKPTLLLDEMDATMNGTDEYVETVRQVLNAGFDRAGVISVCVGQGAAITWKDFSCFGPKAFAGIGNIPDTVADRSIPIAMRRKTKDEVVMRLRKRELGEHTSTVTNLLQRWSTEDSIAHLKQSRPTLPDELGDRQQDISEPLLAIAELAGGAWPELVRAALLKVFQAAPTEGQSLQILLLGDIRDIFQRRKDPLNSDRIATTDLLKELNALEDRPWRDWNKGKGLSSHNLSKKLSAYRIIPGSIRVKVENGEDLSLKGYYLNPFQDAWERYLPVIRLEDRHNDTSPVTIDDLHVLEPAQEKSRAVTKSNENPRQSGSVTLLRFESPISEERETRTRRRY